MRVSVLSLLLLSFFPANDSRAQDAPDASLEHTELDSLGRSAPEAQTPTAKGKTVDERHPRLFWVFPTYNVTDNGSHAPLTASGKWRLYAKDVTDPFSFGWVAFEAGIAQANNNFPGYGQGAAGYGKRLGAGSADAATGGFFGTFLFPSLLHQDPRYYRVGSRPFKKRLANALMEPVLTHNDSGTRAFNWSGILGSIARSSLSNAYYPEGNRGVGATFSRVGMSIPFSMIDELFNEFGPNLQKKLFGKNGSAQEFVETRILGCFLKSDEFGLGDRHALGL